MYAVAVLEDHAVENVLANVVEDLLDGADLHLVRAEDRGARLDRSVVNRLAVVDHAPKDIQAGRSSRPATASSAAKFAISRESLPPCQASGESPSRSLIRRACGSRSAYVSATAEGWPRSATS